ncbi:MAG: IS1 family transposase [Anaerolineae bacterium]
MIQKTITYHCRTCGSINITKNGTNKCGNAQYHCHDCGDYRVLEPQTTYTKNEQKTILDAYRERASMRGLERIFGVARQTVALWIKGTVQELPDLKATLAPAQADDVLELDEAWSFVFKKDQKRWLWTALCRRTRQIVAFVIGDRSEHSCRRLWNKIPDSYKHCHTYSDFWEAYQKVFSSQTHQAVGKETGQTAHMERWYNTLRQRLARFVRKTLSFSKSDAFHHMVTKWFIALYNLACLPLTS